MTETSAPLLAPGRICPPWLAERLRRHGGSVPFRSFMDWALHDPLHGAYASGRLRIGPRGDFATAPSLGDDFAALLAPQLAEWLQELGPGPLSLVEMGPGEGNLAADLAAALVVGWPELAARTELVLVDPSAGLVERQRQRLSGCPMAVRWVTPAELASRPLVGVVLAHEVLDALPVERVVWDGQDWRRQRVALRPTAATTTSEHPAAEGLELVNGERLSDAELGQLATLALADPGPQRPPGWTTELHPDKGPWLAACGAGLEQGVLLVIDYALEAFRYYAPQRSAGTLMAYRDQRASEDPLREPGQWDLTAHLCVESLIAAAEACGWCTLGQRRQGEALLALGLAQRLYGLQQRRDLPLADLLAHREALLRLVDPTALGDFRWLAFRRGCSSPEGVPLFLQDPSPH